ncbi:olfactory receptor class A-like protein 1 [Protopterus annectens]|uniref:olfactory receptor class A-like protein 1 n=1 Tax=Protopterus annectens TaxID=7888 RepID=UPI001CFBC2BC|nr:olfactory receptor class A-like protein 1 [Protopterus annectens]
MDLCVTMKGVSFLLQTSLGIMGNVTILFAYARITQSGSKVMPVDLILAHLAFANMLILLTRGIPQTMTVFGLENLLDDTGCKIIIFLYRIVRALSICLTSLMSLVQLITIAPFTRIWASLKRKAARYVLHSFAALWLLNIAVCIAAPLLSTAPRNGTVPKFTLNLGFCHVHFHNSLSYVINGIAVSGRDFIFVGLMIFSSAYIVLLLYRHSKQVQGIRSSKLNQKSTAEAKATQTVIMLVTLYVVFFGIDNIVWIYMLTVSSVPPVIADMRVFFSSSYASVSPFLIMKSNKKIKSTLCCTAEEEEDAGGVGVVLCHCSTDSVLMETEVRQAVESWAGRMWVWSSKLVMVVSFDTYSPLILIFRDLPVKKKQNQGQLRSVPDAVVLWTAEKCAGRCSALDS